MEIRGLTEPDDIEAAIRVNQAAWSEAYHDILPEEVIQEATQMPPRPRIEERFEQVRESEGEFVVAVESGNIVGYAYLRWGESAEKDFVSERGAELKEIYVHPDSWGHGIGTNLLEETISRGPDTVERIDLEMLAGNEVGRQFYESRGFEQTGTSEFQIGEEIYPTTIYSLEV